MIRPNDLRNKRVLISPLNWGMGHVSRCIGLIHQLRNQENQVVVACDLQQRKVFEEYFDGIEFVHHEGYPFRFGGKGHFGWDLFIRSNALRKRLKQEEKEVVEMVRTHQIDVLIADHRYGFRSDDIPSVFLTHQVNLPVKWYEKGVNALHQKLMKRFTYVWVLDDEASSLAGKLSENCPSNGCYIGHYSRFSLYPRLEEKSVEKVLVASGPEPYALQLIRNRLNDVNQTELFIIHATAQDFPHQCKGSWREKDEWIRSARTIISYSGYSTLMDCLELGVQAELTPTKGQAEQIYLAARWKKYRNSPQTTV